jgi:hypothetical protein
VEACFQDNIMLTSNKEIIAEAERRAIDDYKAVLGTIIEVADITGYNERDDSIDVYGPFKVRVDTTDEPSVLHWNDEHLDPYWDVTPVGEYAELAGMRSFWVHGHSYLAEEGKPLQEAERAFVG